MTKPILVLTAALLAVLAGLAPAGASAARGMEIALQDDGVFVQRGWYDREAALSRARALGVTKLRVNVLWSRVVLEPTRRRPPQAPTYDWAPFDTLIADAARHGITLQMTIVGPAPAWATGDRRVGIVAPDPRHFARFAADVARHFAGRVDRYSIWNEPNWHSWLAPSRSCRAGHWGRRCDARLGRLYRRLYARSHAAIKRVDPRAAVLFGEFAPQGRPGSATAPLAMLRAVTCSRPDWRAARRCGGLRADGFAHHPYAFTTEPSRHYGGPDDVVIGSLGRLTRALDRLAARRALRTPSGRPLDLYLTEHGYFAAGRRRVSAATRAAWLKESFDVALRNRRVRQLLQYLLVAPPAARDTFPTHVMTERGRPTRPYRALASWARRNRHRIARPRPLRRQDDESSGDAQPAPAEPQPAPAEPQPAPEEPQPAPEEPQPAAEPGGSAP